MEHKNMKNHENHMNHHIKDFRNRFYISLILTLPILILSPLIQNILGFNIEFNGSQILQYILSTIIFIYGGYPFLKGSVDEIKNKSIGMMTLIALAISIAYIYSSAVVLGLQGQPFFWELATLIVIMLLGHWIEMRSVSNASKALEKLSHLIPDKAHLKKDGNIVDIETEELKNGHVVLIKPGERIPADGIVVKGNSYVNESIVTGESSPISKSINDSVIGGSVNQDGSLEVKITATSGDTYISKVIDLVKKAQKSKSETQTLADKAAYWLTIIAISAGLITFVVWLLVTGNVTQAITRTATVLVITCPHALGLAIPLVVAVSTTLSAKNGLLIRNRTAFENSRKIDTVVLDKTGTLTNGEFNVKEVITQSKEYTQEDILKTVATLETNSEHPIAQAIVENIKEKDIKLPNIEDFKAMKGKGVQGRIGNQKYLAISLAYSRELGIDISNKTLGTVVNLVKQENNKYILLGTIVLGDTIRKDAKELVDTLHETGIKVIMLTGDNQQTAKEVADKLGIDNYYSQVLPDQKQTKLKEIQKGERFVLMVGDGINDAPALAQADLGIAIGSGTDIAAETADVILVKDKLLNILTVINFGRKTYNKMVQNLIWATAYNFFAIPLAAGVLFPLGIILSPAVGAILMSLSTVIVAINAKLLRLE
jgi:Cu2+-exporting ATPase